MILTANIWPGATLAATSQPLGQSVSFSNVEARADSIAVLSALLLVAQREGDFPSLLKGLSEKERESRTIQDDMLALMDRMDPQLARRGGDLAAFLVEPPNLLKPTNLKQTLQVLLPFIQTIPESLAAFGAFCLSAGLMLRQDGEYALAGRYFEKASGTLSPLATHALYLAVESGARSHEPDRMLKLLKALDETAAPDYLRRRGRLVVALALCDAGRDSDALGLLESLLKADLNAGDRTRVAAALARLYERRGDYEMAATSNAQAFETGSSNGEAVEAARAYLRLVKEGRTGEDASRTLSAARCLMRAGLRSEAASLFGKLFHAKKPRLEAGWELARLHYRMKKYAEAKDVFLALGRLEKDAGGSLQIKLWVARCERQLTNTEVAIELFRRVAFDGKRVKYSEAAWELGLELESLRRLREAAEVYQLLGAQLPETRLGQESLWRKGLCEYKLGAIGEAEVAFTSLLKGEPTDWLHDAALFWLLKCSAERGSPVSSAELEKEKRRSESLYGLLLESLSNVVALDSLRTGSARIGDRVRSEILKSPWKDWRLGQGDGLGRVPAAKLTAPSPPATDVLLLSPSGPGGTELSEGLPPRAQGGALLLEFGLRDLAIEELRGCEREFSGRTDVLFLLAQLYWRHGLYKQAMLVAERLANGGQGMDEGEKRFLERMLYPICYADVLLPESRAQAVDPFLALAVMKRESTFDPGAQSSASATGLMQLMPETAGAIAAYLGEDTRKLDLRDPGTNLRYGIWHLGRLIGRYSDSVVTALAAYNAGEENAERWTRAARGASSNDGFVYMESVAFRETREYIRLVLADLQVYRKLYLY